MSGKVHYCFVCDIATNKYFSLATCRTQSSKKKIVERLGQLVGEKYMVVITEDDVICRSCANLMNTLDRLESEMGSVRRVVLKFLEKKYSLEEGELLNQKNIQGDAEKQSTPSFMMRKKKADEDFGTDNECTAEDPRSRIWMQCDKCQYTTNYTSFVNNHIRNEVCLNCEGPMKNGVCLQECDKDKMESGTITSITNDKNETLALVGNSISFLNGSNDEGLSLIAEDGTIQEKLSVALNVNEANEINLSEVKQVDEDDEEREAKPALYLQVVDDEDDFDSGNVRQVLAVTNDGAVEMMEVMWNEETNSPVTELTF